MKEMMSRASVVWNAAKLSAAAYAAYALLSRLPISCILCSEQPEDLLHADRLAKIHMLKKLQENSRIKFVGALRLPDSDNKNYKDIDLVILIKRNLYLVEVKNWSGEVNCEPDGIWCQKCVDGSWFRHEDIDEEGKRRAALLESYLRRRGLELPSSSVQSIIVFANPHCRLDKTILSIPTVISSQKWEAFLRKKSQRSRLGWIIPNKNKLMSDGLFEQLLGVLYTAPTWDRLTLYGDHIVFGNFLHFNGLAKDMEHLKKIKRSRVSDVSITSKEEHIEILGIHVKTASWAEVRCTVRDYRRESASKTENRADESALLVANVRGNSQVVFQAVGSICPQVFKVECVLSIHLSA